jgi:hypothetical protein
VPVETPDTTSFLRNALRDCAVLFKKVVLFKAVLFQVCGPAASRRFAGPLDRSRPDRGGWASWPQQTDT